MSDSRIQVTDLTADLKHQNQLLNLQNKILEDFVKWKKPSKEILDELCLCAEQLTPGALASIMLLNKDSGTLSVQSAPSAPQSVIDDLENLKPSPTNGSCANAVYSGEPTFVKDTSCDMSWTNIRFIADKYNIKACWSFPVLDSVSHPIGSFALSSMENRLPNEFQENLLRVCANLVSLICQRESHKQELWDIANKDVLTGLPNRSFLETQMKHSIISAKRNNNRLGLMFFRFG